MAISVKKLSGKDIPQCLREDEKAPDVVFQVEDADGQLHHRQSDIEAAALAVELSEKAKSDAGDA